MLAHCGDFSILQFGTMHICKSCMPLNVERKLAIVTQAERYSLCAQARVYAYSKEMT